MDFVVSLIREHAELVFVGVAGCLIVIFRSIRDFFEEA